MKEKKQKNQPADNSEKENLAPSSPMEISDLDLNRLTIEGLVEEIDLLKVQNRVLEEENAALRSSLEAHRQESALEKDAVEKVLDTLDEMSKGIALPEVLKISKDGSVFNARPDLIVGWIQLVRDALKSKHGVK